MAMSYYKTYKVPTWVLLNKMSPGRRQATLKWFKEAGAVFVEWPAKTFPKALFEYRNKGYAHALPEYPFTLDTELLQRAAAEHLKNTMGPTSYLAGSVGTPTSRLNRRVERDEDLVTVFNDLLSLEDPIAMSQIFQVAERCHRDDVSQSKAWVSTGPGVPKNLLTRIADRVITIGDDEKSDISVAGLEKENLIQKLESYFSNKETNND